MIDYLGLTYAWKKAAKKYFQALDASGECFANESLMLAYYELLIVMSAEFQ